MRSDFTDVPCGIHEVPSYLDPHHPAEKGKAPASEAHRGTSPAGPRVLDEGLVHILSMGSKALMLQVWADFCKGSLTFR